VAKGVTPASMVANSHVLGPSPASTSVPNSFLGSAISSSSSGSPDMVLGTPPLSSTNYIDRRGCNISGGGSSGGSTSSTSGGGGGRRKARVRAMVDAHREELLSSPEENDTDTAADGAAATPSSLRHVNVSISHGNIPNSTGGSGNAHRVYSGIAEKQEEEEEDEVEEEVEIEEEECASVHTLFALRRGPLGGGKGEQAGKVHAGDVEEEVEEEEEEEDEYSFLADGATATTPYYRAPSIVAVTGNSPQLGDPTEMHKMEESSTKKPLFVAIPSPRLKESKLTDSWDKFREQGAVTPISPQQFVVENDFSGSYDDEQFEQFEYFEG
jgi:hypothetical protein